MSNRKRKYYLSVKGVVVIGILCFVSIITLMGYSSGRIATLNYDRQQIHSVLHQWYVVDAETLSLLSGPVSNQDLNHWYGHVLELDKKISQLLANPKVHLIVNINPTSTEKLYRIGQVWGGIKSEYEKMNIKLLECIESDPAVASGDGYGLLYSFGYYRQSDLTKDKYAGILEIINQNKYVTDKSKDLRETVMAELDYAITDGISQATIGVQVGVSIFSLVTILATTLLMAQRLYRSKKNKAILEKLVNEKTTQAQESRQDVEKIKKQLQASFLHVNKLVQENNEITKSKGEFLAKISHKIRTPMNAIIGFSEVLVGEDIDEKYKDQVEIIHESGRSLLQIINDILDFSKMESGKFNVELISCSPETVVNSVTNLFKQTAEIKGISLSSQISSDVPQAIVTDPARLKQCLINIVGNAMKFTDSGRVEITVSVQYGIEESILFDIKDTGVGIPEYMRETVFEPFFQTDGASRKYGGTGLGLAITKKMVELLGGKIEFTSSSTNGTTFSLLIPSGVEAETHEAKGVKVEIEKQLAPSLLSRKIETGKDLDIKNKKLSGKVLVAEDSHTNQSLITLVLSKMGLESVVVADGAKAVAAAQSRAFDVVLMDIQMPVMNGYEATKALREEGFETPIIALTANAMIGDEQKCYDAGCNDYLSKPINTKKLFNILSKYLSSRDDALPASKGKIKGVKKMSNENVNSVSEQVVLIDWDLLMSRMGDEELADEILPIFLEDSIERMVKLTAACESDDCQEVKFFAHAIKGSAGTVGAADLSSLAAELETAGRDEDVEKIHSLFPKFKEVFDALVEFLSKDDWKAIAKQQASDKEKITHE